jgi:integral membrane sensor domain MASE1
MPQPLWIKTAILIITLIERKKKMGPIGCLAGLIAQIVHLIVLIVTLPIVIICSIFGGKKE